MRVIFAECPPKCDYAFRYSTFQLLSNETQIEDSWETVFGKDIIETSVMHIRDRRIFQLVILSCIRGSLHQISHTKTITVSGLQLSCNKQYNQYKNKIIYH